MESWRAIRFLGSAMTKPYSADLRVRVVGPDDEGATRQEAAERFGVSVRSPEAARRCFGFWSVTLHVKKVLRAAEQERTDVARARRRLIREQGLLDTTHLVFIDETSVDTNMTGCMAALRGANG